MSNRPTSMKVDGIVYWTIMTYDANGVLVDADSTPTVAVRKNGASVADAVTVTKRSATTGIYDVSYNPAGEAEGDCFGLEETATVSSQAYLNAWSIEVEAVERGTDSALLASDKPTNFDLLTINGSGEVTTSNPASGGGSAHTAQDVADLILVTPANKLATDVSGNVEANNMRGTDGANTVAPVDVSTDVAAILADTNELQTNQGQWLTATGFSTFDHTTDAVITDTASRDASKADVSGLSTFDATTDQVVASNMRGTDGANTIAPVDVSASVALILADTNELQQNQGQWLTATGFNTVAPDNAGITSISNAVSALNDISASDVWNSLHGAGYAAGSFGEDLLLALNSNRTIQVTASNHVAADIHEVQTDGIHANGIAADAVVKLQAGLATQVSIDALNDFNPATDTVANVTLVDTTTNLTNGGSGGGSSAADIYTYFTDGTREDAFKADTSGLSTFDPASDTVARVTLVDTTTDLTNQTAGGIGMFQASVRVQDSNGDALQGARINVDGTTLSLTTGVSGEVVFNLDSGVYLLNLLPPANYGTPSGQVLTITSSDPAQTVFTLDTSGGCGTPWIG